MSNTLQLAPVRLRIWQQNLNKSRVALEDLINSKIHNNYDLLILQELFINMLGNTKATSCWRVVYPSSRRVDSLLPQAVMLINTEINTNRWSQICISDTRDMVAVQFTGDFGLRN